MAFRELTDDELLAFAKRCEHPGLRESLTEMGSDGIEDYDGAFLVHEGDLVVEGSFDTDERDLTVLVVDGSVRVTGLWEDRCNDGPTCVLVLGSLFAGNVLTAGFLEVKEDLVAKEAIVGDYNDGGVLVHGDLRAALFLPFDHAFEIRGADQAEETIEGLTTETKPRRLASSFHAKTEQGFRLFAGEKDDSTMLADLRGGRSILA